MRENPSLTEIIEEHLLNSDIKRVREVDLARLFGVSRVPIREALKTLTDKGLIERKRRAGTSLRKLTLSELNEIYD